MKKYFILLSLLSLLTFGISVTSATTIPSYLPNTTFSYSAWIPYWSRWTGVDELYASTTANGTMIYNSNFFATSSAEAFGLGVTAGLSLLIGEGLPGRVKGFVPGFTIGSAGLTAGAAAIFSLTNFFFIIL